VVLSGLGTSQAAALGAWLADQPSGSRPELVVCSPYSRARQTWQVMAKRAADLGAAQIETLVDERLRDREWGCFELYPPAALRARNPQEADRRELMGELYYRPPGGEAFSDVVLRVNQFVSDLGRAAPGRRVLVVAHDSVVIALRYVLAGIGAALPDQPPPVPNASVSHWIGNGGLLSLATWADTAHLTSLNPTEGTALA
jgi:broad specificity phosphatase PhoE